MGQIKECLNNRSRTLKGKILMGPPPTYVKRCAPCDYFIPVVPDNKFKEYTFYSTQEDLFNYYKWIQKK